MTWPRLFATALHGLFRKSGGLFRKAAFSALYIFERIGLEDAKSLQRDAAFMIGSRESRYCAEAVIRMER